MNADIEQVLSHFADKISAIKTCFSLRETDDLVLQDIAGLVDELSFEFRNIRQQLTKSKQSLELSEKLLSRLNKINSDVKHANEHLPRCLPKKTIEPKKSEPSSLVLVDKSNNALQNNEQPKTETKPKDMAKKNVIRKPCIPSMSPLTVQEFDDIPKYLKGRVRYDTINNIIHEFNSVIESKYKVLQMPRKQLSPTDLNLYRRFKSEEANQTKGVFFCVAEDFASFSKLKLDKATLNIFSILRHCKRIREIRDSKKVVRYALV